MLKFILRKTVYRKLIPEAQDVFFKLILKQQITVVLCVAILILIAFMPHFLLLILGLCEPELHRKTAVSLVVGLVGYSGLMGCFIGFFFQEIKEFIFNVSCKLYFLLVTRKGEALTDEDFKTIAEKDYTLYKGITTNKCCGFCYAVCFGLMKNLEKGSIKFIAAKNVFPTEEDKDKDYYIHVLYVNNGWAFDTNCQRQIPVEELLGIYQAKVYGDFSYEEVKDLSYEKFRYLNSSNIRRWCEENNVFTKWK